MRAAEWTFLPVAVVAGLLRATPEECNFSERRDTRIDSNGQKTGRSAHPTTLAEQEDYYELPQQNQRLV